ncbi:MAG: 4'-phosphopantetheinyl transferase superfamily protein [Spirochaetales bacterium]|nr:4'-phosphopantetheinyl transferase superfamily protein [Spirochaetales bacterium]
MDLEIVPSPEIPGLLWTQFPLPLPDSLRREGLALLREEEKGRYERFAHEPSRDMFLAARLFSKTLLGDLLSLPPDRIVFSYKEGGKPYLKDHRDLFFNLSHSAGTAAFISSERGECGVDVEEIKGRDCLSLARHFFSADETALLERTEPAEAMRELFFEIWTQKEAYLKGTGKGLPGGLKHYTVPRVSGAKEQDGFILGNFRPSSRLMGAYALSSS